MLDSFSVGFPILPMSACCPALQSNQWHGIFQRFSFGIGRTFVVVSACPNLNLVFKRILDRIGIQISPEGIPAYDQNDDFPPQTF